MNCVVCFNKYCACRPRTLILALLMFLVPVLSFAECDIKKLKNEVLAPFSSPIPYDTITGRGWATLEKALYPDSTFTVKGDSFILTVIEMKVTHPHVKTHNKSFMVIRGVDLASCRLETFDYRDVFATNIN
jgi:hypothetical protein